MNKPLVGVVVGSKSDKVILDEVKSALRKFDVPFVEKIISAHRTPDQVREFAQEAEENGLEVIVAGAGKAAHLPGVVASYTTLPVIGVPVETKDLGGLDSLLSIVQMPSGVPVATVAIGGAKNAAILAVQILANNHPELREKLKSFKQELISKTQEKS